MILKGNQRGYGSDLAKHLLNVDDNEHATVHQLRGFVSESLQGAFKEAEAISLGTKCQQYLFSLSLNPPPDADVVIKEFVEAIETIETKLQLTGQPRAIIFHEKKGRRHARCVWSRVDPQTMKAINLPHFKRKLQDVAQDLFRTHGWEMPAGFTDSANRDPDTFDRIEAAQAKQASSDPKILKSFFRKAWEQSDSKAAFAAALLEKGFILAKGSRRAFVAVDAQGRVFSLSRWTGARAKALSNRIGSVDSLPSISIATGQLVDQPRQNPARQNLDLRTLIARQRDERKRLSNELAKHKNRRVKQRQGSLPKGLRAVWARLTGQYQDMLARLSAEADADQSTANKKWDALIAQHLNDRRVLKAKCDNHDSFLAMRDKLLAPGLPSDPRQRLVLPSKDRPPSVLTIEFRPEVVLDQLNDKQDSFNKKDITKLLKRAHDDEDWCNEIWKRIHVSPELVELSSDSEPRYTAKSFQTAEKQLFVKAEALSQRMRFAVSHRHIIAASHEENARLETVGARLSQEQKEALSHITQASALSCLVGYAGAGKSTLLNAARSAWTAQGYTVLGLTLAGKAADGLTLSSGISSRTIASLETSWKNGHDPISPGSVIVIDEVGMVGTLQLSRILAELSKRDCKVVLVGDPDQLQPIEAGTPFRELLVRNAHASLTEVRRQNEDWQREASINLAQGRLTDAVSAYRDRGHVYDHTDRTRAIQALAQDYLIDIEAYGHQKSRLALAHRRKDVFALNQAIRAGRVIAGDLHDDLVLATDHGPRAFAAGDRVLFTKNNIKLGVRNGMLGTVQSMPNGCLRIRLDEAFVTIDIDPNTYCSVDHGYAVSIHKSQGSTVDHSFVFDGPTMDQHLTYVAATRHREKMQFYRMNQDSQMALPRRKLVTRDGPRLSG